MDAAVMYTKLMWLRHRSAEFIHQLLSYPLVEDAWTRSMSARQQPTARLAFCCAVAQLDNLESVQERRTALFELAERHLGVREHLHITEVEARVKNHERELINELSQREFGHFLASNQCNNLILQLRELHSSQLHLEPPLMTSPSGADERAADKLVQMIDAALREFPAAVLLCDRTVGGLPIVSCSAGVQRVTGYVPNEMLGWKPRESKRYSQSMHIGHR